MKVSRQSFEEISNLSIVAGVIAEERPMILSTHTIGSLTQLVYMPSRCRANLWWCMVLSADFDRSRGNVNPQVYATEKNGFDHADK